MLKTAKFTARRSGVILHHPIVSSDIRSQIDQIPVFRNKLLALYRRFYRLRNMIYTGHSSAPIAYHTILRRDFERIDFNVRRNAVLGKEIENHHLSEAELLTRMINTVMFVFNSTVSTRNADEEEPEVLFFQDIKKTVSHTMESSIVSTILRMDSQKPDSIKYDFKYAWIEPFDQFMEGFDEYFEKHPSSKRYGSKYPMNWIGFRQYETTLMRLNESLGLCL
ncbi:hypothetical protein G9P44_004187 [Scheffersomyces stipitis]|nr:hypothetical protein G9P44_004187 [Scheffersomyces stipitis]